jgi:DNA polymerase-3 subunit beta
MKFVCDGLLLSDAAFIVSKACATRTVNPILECIKLQAKNDTLTLTAYDGEISIEKNLKADILEEGETCVNGKFFADFVGKISFSEVTLIADEKGVVIRYGESESYMQSLPSGDFPVFNGDGINQDNYFEIQENELIVR